MHIASGKFLDGKLKLLATPCPQNIYFRKHEKFISFFLINADLDPDV